MKKITKFDWPDGVMVADGCGAKREPDITRANLIFLAGKFNEMADEIEKIKKVVNVGD